MLKIKRVAYATLTTPDLERQITYWRSVMGLQLVDRTPDSAMLATKLGLPAIALRQGTDCHLEAIGFQVDPDSDLRAHAATLRGAGIDAQLRDDLAPGIGPALTFTDPQGIRMEVFKRAVFYAQSSDDIGVDTLKLGHVAYRVNDMRRAVDFYCQVLGFRVSDLVGGKFAFLRCGVDHHSINFARYDKPALHHLAFEVKDWAAVQRGCEVMLRNQYQLVWGPLRHVVGHNVAAYHRNPDDVRVEIYCEMDMMKDEELGYWEPRPWHEEIPLRPRTWPEDTPRSAWGFGSVGNFPGYP